MSAPEISGHVELPFAYMTEEQVEQLLTRFGHRPGILLDPDEIDQSPETRSEGDEPQGHDATRPRPRVVCYALNRTDFWVATGRVSPWGGMVCFRRG